MWGSKQYFDINRLKATTTIEVAEKQFALTWSKGGRSKVPVAYFPGFGSALLSVSSSAASE